MSDTIQIDHFRRAGGRFHLSVLFRSAAFEVLVRIELVAQTAHESSAHARYLLRVEREILLFGHADRHRAELAAQALAAQLLAAMSQTAHHARLVAHADLAHIHTHAELRRQLAHKIAEVDALLGLEVKDSLVTVEQVLDGHRVHVRIGFCSHLLE